MPSFWKALKGSFEQILIPQAVLDEILKGRDLGTSDVREIEKAIEEGWFKVMKVKQGRTPVLPENLGEGEKEAIFLMMTLEGEKIDWLLMDDEIAAKTARSMGLEVRPVSYMPIYWTKRREVKMSEGIKMLDDLVRVGYRLSAKDYVAIKDMILGTL